MGPESHITSKSYQAANIFDVHCILLCVSGLTIACIICCRVNVTLDTILGVDNILISWFVISLALTSSIVCCMIHCKHWR